MRLITLTILNLTCIIAFTQTPAENLKKYWTYRERLKKYFIAISPNNEPGTNIPAMRITATDTISWGDGNGSMQYYIGMLATEYRLLQLYGQDYSQTRNELLYALRALKRLDENAEKYFREPQTAMSDDYNGFFIRDDVNNNVKKINYNLNSFVINSTFKDRKRRDGLKREDGSFYPYENSKDNVWHYLLNLALVKALVDDAEIKNLAIEIAFKMVNYMHYNDWTQIWVSCGIKSSCWPGHWVKAYTECWRIINPVFKKDVEDGARVDEIGWCCESIDGFSYGFAEAGNWVIKNTGYPNLHYGCSTTKQNWFEQNLSRPPYVTINDGTDIYWSGVDTYSYRALTTVAGLPFMGNTDTYNFLVTRSYNDFNHPYEHMALIYTLLHGNGQNFFSHYLSEFNRYETLLNSAPSSGTYNFGNTPQNNLPHRPVEWSVDNRLVWPENLGKDPKLGYFNGIDFMLLHNLFWLTYIQPYSKMENSTYINFPTTHNVGSSIFPQTINSPQNVTVTGTISNGGYINLNAWTIVLNNGFEIQSQNCFNAITGNYIPKINYPIFQKITDIYPF